jgi:monoamine oxidase
MKEHAYDVMVVGAGAAGLNAARLLALAGKRVVLLEARNRVGGRIFTEARIAEPASYSVPIELGAEFVHGLPESTWSLVREAALNTYELSGSSYRYTGDRLISGNEQLGDAERVLEDMADTVLHSQFKDVSFADYMKGISVDPLSAQAARNYVEGFNAADERRISVISLAMQQRAEDAIAADRLFRLESGYDTLPVFLAQQFQRAGGELALNSEAKKIFWTRGEVTLQAMGSPGPREFRAACAVITVPLGVLQAGCIEFIPRPAETLRQAGRLVMGPVMRMTFVFKRKLWTDTLSFIVAPTEVPSAWWSAMPHEAPVLTAWAGGPKAESLLRLVSSEGDATALCAQCLSSLAKILGRPVADIETNLSSWHFHNWQTDPLTRGAYSYVPAGALDAPEHLQRPVEDTLYFAGEHTDTTSNWGTVHAALAAGEGAAAKILGRARST